MPPKKADAGAAEVSAARFGRVRNNLRMGIVGLPNVGKSSLFNLLTKQSIAVRAGGSGVEERERPLVLARALDPRLRS